MNKMFVTICLLLSLVAIPSANAENVTVFDKALNPPEFYSPTGDFIIYNNSPYLVILASHGWGQSDILYLNGQLEPAIQPYSVRAATVTLNDKDKNTGFLTVASNATGNSAVKISANFVNFGYVNWGMDYYSTDTSSPTSRSSVVKASSSANAPPPNVTTGALVQKVIAPLVFTFFVNVNRDRNNNHDAYTGNTKIILVVTDYTANDVSLNQVTSTWSLPVY